MTTSKDYDEKYANGWMTLIRDDNDRGSHSLLGVKFQYFPGQN